MPWVSPKALAVTRAQSCLAAEQLDTESSQSSILRTESHADARAQGTLPCLAISRMSCTDLVSGSPARDAPYVADAQTEQGACWLLL